MEIRGIVIFGSLVGGNAARGSAIRRRQSSLLSDAWTRRRHAGGKFAGSNVSELSGYVTLATINVVPLPGQWTEIRLPATKTYRWIRYEAPPGSHGNVAEIEFYSGNHKLTFPIFGSVGNRDLRTFAKAMDGNVNTWFDSSVADDQYVGIDLGAWCDPPPKMTPPAGVMNAPTQVTLHADTPKTIIRYSFAGTPDAVSGTLYSGPITIDHTATLFAVAFRPGMAPSAAACGTYIVGTAPKAGLTTFHIGNSLSGLSVGFPNYVYTTGRIHHAISFIVPGSTNTSIWKNFVMKQNKAEGGVSWNQTFASLSTLDDFVLEVSNPNLEQETDSDLKFLDAVRAKCPGMQPWLYSIWERMFRLPLRGVALGEVPSLQVKKSIPR